LDRSQAGSPFAISMDEETGFANISWKEDNEEGRADAPADVQTSASALKPTVVNSAASQEQVKGTRITCSVTNPQKEQDGTKDAFISFAVITNTDYPTFQNPHVEVRRRFTDFLFLYRALRREFPSCAVPPLPEKHKMGMLWSRQGRLTWQQSISKAIDSRRNLRTGVHPHWTAS